MNRRVVAGLAVALLGGLSAGCGGGDGVRGVPVKGTVVVNGKPLQLKGSEQLAISLVRLDGGQSVAATGSYNPGDGSFTVAGPTNRGIPEGKYRITVSTNDYGPRSQGDRFRGLFGANNSPLVVTLNSDNADRLVVDVGRKSVVLQ
jgi:hypothetical protein